MKKTQSKTIYKVSYVDPLGCFANKDFSSREDAEIFAKWSNGRVFISS